MKAQKGQDIIEFALLLPIFILIIIGIMYIGFFFSDYMTLSNLARSAARDAVVTTTTKDISKGDEGIKKERDFSGIINQYDKILTNEHITTSLYLYKQGSLEITPSTLPQSDSNAPETAVKVDIPMTLNEKQGFVEALFNLGILSDDDKEYHIVYYMHDENPVT